MNSGSHCNQTGTLKTVRILIILETILQCIESDNIGGDKYGEKDGQEKTTR